jgi:hypothetical protein
MLSVNEFLNKFKFGQSDKFSIVYIPVVIILIGKLRGRNIFILHKNFKKWNARDKREMQTTEEAIRARVYIV